MCCQILSRDHATTNEVNEQKKARGLVILIICEINTKKKNKQKKLISPYLVQQL